MSTAVLADVLTRHRVDERERALRSLLMQPLMTAAHPDFGSVRRHAEFLRGWVAREAGWVLQVDRDCARLYKRPATLDDATRGVEGFDRPRYALFCLVCAVLERAEPQITLRTLGDRLLASAADPELCNQGFRFTLTQVHERRELVSVCRYLMRLDVLRLVAGEEDSFIRQSGDALYDVQRRALAGLLACTRGPSTFPAGAEPSTLADRLAAITEEYIPENTEGRRAAVRYRLARRLLDDPVVYFDELSEEEREYLANQRGAMASRFGIATGMEPELRAEGLALIDKDGELTDMLMPAEGTVAHVTLLVAQMLAVNTSQQPRFHSLPEVAAFIRRASEEYGKYWRKNARDPGAETDLAREALERLVALKLVRITDAGIEPRPALARYAPDTPHVRPIRNAQLPLE